MKFRRGAIRVKDLYKWARRPMWNASKALVQPALLIGIVLVIAGCGGGGGGSAPSAADEARAAIQPLLGTYAGTWTRTGSTSHGDIQILIKLPTSYPPPGQQILNYGDVSGTMTSSTLTGLMGIDGIVNGIDGIGNPSSFHIDARARLPGTGSETVYTLVGSFRKNPDGSWTATFKQPTTSAEVEATITKL
jgi:hypothetical protein